MSSIEHEDNKPLLYDFFKPYSKFEAACSTKSCNTGFKVSRNQTPKTLVWDITFRCNLKCIHCYNADKYGYSSNNYGNNFSDLTSEQCKQALDRAQKSGIIHLHLLGGEPLCRRDLPELIHYAVEKGLCVTITSNGTLLTETLAKDIIKAGAEQVSISIDGATPSKNDIIRGDGSFNRAIKGLKQLSDARKILNSSFEIGISFTMTQNTLFDLPEVIEIGRENEVDVIVIEDLFDLGISERHPELLYTNSQQISALENLCSYLLEHPSINSKPTLQLDVSYPLFRYLERKYPTIRLVTPERTSVCPAVTSIIYMDSSGNIYPCGVSANLKHSRPELNDDIISPEGANNLANIESFQDVKFDNFLKTRKNAKFDKAPCDMCDYKNDCLPCPLVVHNNKNNKAFGMCLEILKRENKFEKSILKSVIKLKNTDLLASNDIRKLAVIGRGQNQNVQISETGQTILGIISESKAGVRVSELIDKINEIYNVPNIRTVTRDVVDFVWYLYQCGVVEKVNYTKN